VSLLTFTATFAISKANGAFPPDQYIPFLSSSIDYAPESCIGSFGLSFCSFLLTILIAANYQRLQDALENSLNEHVIFYSRLNRIALISGMLSALGLLGVAAFQYHNAQAVHNTCAATFFLLGSLTVNLTAHIHARMKGRRAKLKRACALLSILLVLPFEILLLVYHSHREYPILVNMSAACEILATGSFFAYYVLHYDAFDHYELTYKVRRDTLLNHVDR
jgi:hypothetical membrane protein